MRYNIGDEVVLNDEALTMNAGDVVKVDKVETWKHGFDTYVYNGDFQFRFTDDFIDHEATDEYIMKQIFSDIPEFDPWNGSVDPKESLWEEDSNSLSLTIEIKGAKEYRDKLEELHRQIETVEYLIEELNEMEIEVELKDD